MNSGHTPTRPALSSSRPDSETVILLHGIWMNGLCLYPLAQRLQSQGYSTICFSYRSLQDNLSTIIHRLHRHIANLETKTVHFVGHSLGGLIVQRFLEAYPRGQAGRVVTLGTPFAGSVVAQRLYAHSAGRRLLGRCAEDGLLVERAPPWRPTQALGVIAGTKPAGIGQYLINVPPPSDGTVRVAETELAGMADRCLVGSSHTGLAFSSLAARQTGAFLKQGAFIT